jgi:hypothetical protein
VKLVDLDPRWLEVDGEKVGFVFTCPTKPDFRMTCFFRAGLRRWVCERCNAQDIGVCEHSQMGLVKRALGQDLDEPGSGRVQLCNPKCGWKVLGAMDFETLSIMPSLDGSAGGLWHGHITQGLICGGI